MPQHEPIDNRPSEAGQNLTGLTGDPSDLNRKLSAANAGRKRLTSCNALNDPVCGRSAPVSRKPLRQDGASVENPRCLRRLLPIPLPALHPMGQLGPRPTRRCTTPSRPQPPLPAHRNKSAPQQRRTTSRTLGRKPASLHQTPYHPLYHTYQPPDRPLLRPRDRPRHQARP